MTNRQKILQVKKPTLEKIIDNNLSKYKIIKEITGMKKPCKRDYNVLDFVLNEFNLYISDENNSRRSSPIFKLEKRLFLKIVENSHTVEEVLNFFGLKNRSANAETLKDRFEKENIDYLEFLSKRKHLSQPPIIKHSNNKIFIKNSKISRGVVRDRVLKEDLIEYKCAICGINKWRGEKITLTLDHIDGDNKNHTLENLRFLCPNCDSQQPTYCGKNNHTTKSKLPTENEIDKMIKENNSKKLVKDYFKDLYPYLKVKNGYTCECGNYKEKELRRCSDCKKYFIKKEKKQGTARNTNKLDLEKYKNIVQRLNNGESLESIGKELGITGSGLKKRLQMLDLKYNQKNTSTEEKIVIIKSFIETNNRLPAKKEKEVYNLIEYVRDRNRSGLLTEEEINGFNKISPYILNPKQKSIDLWNHKYKSILNFVKDNDRFPKKKDTPSLVQWYTREKNGHASKDRTNEQLDKIEFLKKLEMKLKNSTPRPPREKRDL